MASPSRKLPWRLAHSTNRTGHGRQPPAPPAGQGEQQQQQGQEEVADHLGSVVEEQGDRRPGLHAQQARPGPSRPTNRLRMATARTVSTANPADNSQNATGPTVRTDWASTTSYPHSGVIHRSPEHRVGEHVVGHHAVVVEHPHARGRGARTCRRTRRGATRHATGMKHATAMPTTPTGSAAPRATGSGAGGGGGPAAASRQGEVRDSAAPGGGVGGRRHRGHVVRRGLWGLGLAARMPPATVGVFAGHRAAGDADGGPSAPVGRVHDRVPGAASRACVGRPGR